MTDDPPVSWQSLRARTSARIGLARAGNTISGAAVREFQFAHVRARHAVSATLDARRLNLPQPCIEVESQAADRAEYVRRPDLGRQLSAAGRERLPHGQYDVVFVIADGLSAMAAERQGAAVLAVVRPLLADWRIAPLVVAHRARVALGDEIATCLGARCVVMMIGERPGLRCAESMSLYMTWNPHVGMRDSGRNCISNIHGHGGLSAMAAANSLAWLLKTARMRGYSGVNLKDETCIIEHGAGQDQKAVATDGREE
ncbi:ethanolamine ammonia-lyase [Komagataeibacter rhaeticus]|uniref:Ethanolamine ammonia-lyase small subunit n=1 Tax=Komagataeibacter rhaeticus TaxID=215221 RepID=A0A181CCW5_9PROT|nr:ethanolamine ammonia-lyase subunit EutC [Komagataeibacter rhaeticus]MBL7240052.1 ethanolamine ammonia-lyase subunit EutC [Komagataeibacter rhaeticus]PYD54778.1 ethanolamine ammonia-lyase [Komagataeibacter rhaeticus]QIP36089.1 ethanolamine ammonia-lyase subunit EutC [Komagataeibacter rhaeticus]QOC45850.1 ethanolamine ammonia-lyase subunit EutC [Komagataeibacter rhaeticus]SAY49400.1 Ethanolamine ammonia-lyase light chain [Komagataeibacter rhaeticus]